MQTAAKETKRSRAIDYLMKQQDATAQQIAGSVIITYTASDGRPCVAVFGPRGFRPDSHYKLQSEAARVQFIEKETAKIYRQQAEAQERAKHYKAEGDKMQPGAIVVDSWGYEQTNIDFYLITARVGDMVTLQPIGQRREYTGDMQGNCTPDPETFAGDPIRRKVNKWGAVAPYSFSCGRIWDGRPMGWSSYA